MTGQWVRVAGMAAALALAAVAARAEEAPKGALGLGAAAPGGLFGQRGQALDRAAEERMIAAKWEAEPGLNPETHERAEPARPTYAVEAAALDDGIGPEAAERANRRHGSGK